jgi:hypothetical protein
VVKFSLRSAAGGQNEETNSEYAEGIRKITIRAEGSTSRYYNSLELSLPKEVIFKAFWRGSRNRRPLFLAKRASLGDDIIRQLTRSFRGC